MEGNTRFLTLSFIVFASLYCSVLSSQPEEHYCYKLEYKTIVVVECIDPACTQTYTVTKTLSYFVRECCEGWYGEYCTQKIICDELRVTDVLIGDIFKVSTDLLDPFTVNLDALPSPQRPIGIAVDKVLGIMFYTDIIGKEIWTANIDGSDPQFFYDTGTDSQCFGIAVDDTNQIVFYTDTGPLNNAGPNVAAKIVSIQYVGRVAGTATTILQTNLNDFITIDKPRDIEVDIAERQVYYTDWGVLPGIKRINYDGSLHTFLVFQLNGDDIVWPNGIALDLEAGTMYWCDAYLEVIKKANLDGTSVELLYQAPNEGRFNDIELSGNYLYLTNWDVNNIQRISKYGGPLEDFGESLFSARAMAIAEVCRLEYVYSQYCCCEGYYGLYCDIYCPAPFIWNPQGSPCLATCENPNPVCLPGTVPSCECPAGQVLLGNTCVPPFVCPPQIGGPEIGGPYDCGSNSPCSQGNGQYPHVDKDRYVACIDGRCSIEKCDNGLKFVPGSGCDANNDLNIFNF